MLNLKVAETQTLDPREEGQMALQENEERQRAENERQRAEQFEKQSDSVQNSLKRF
jgi:hypothetical protein